MAFEFRIESRSESIDKESPTAIINATGEGSLPTLIGGDFFDYVSSASMAWAMSTIETAIGPLYLNNIQVSEVHYGMKYNLVLSYSKNNRQTGAYQISYNGTGGTVHVTAGTLVNVYGDAPAKEKVSALIGEDGDEVHGIDIPTPVCKITVSYRHPKAFLNRDYLDAVSELTGHYNHDTFLGYPPGEIRFMGPDATESEAEATAQYSFERSPNMANFVVDGIQISSKKGWEVLTPVFASDAPGGHARRKVKYWKVIKDPGGVGDKNFKKVFGWG